MPKQQQITFLIYLTLLTILNAFSFEAAAQVVNPEVVEGSPPGKRNVDWIPAFQLVEVKPQSRFRRGDHIIRYYIGALTKEGKFYRPRSEVQVAEVFLNKDIYTNQLLNPGLVFVYPERIFRFENPNSVSSLNGFKIGLQFARLAANNSDLNFVNLSNTGDLRLPGLVRRFSQSPRDQKGNPTEWATDRIGFSNSTIGRYGCVLATLAMMLDYLGINYEGEMDPGVLNERLKKAYSTMDIKAFSAGDRLVLDRAVEAGSGGKAKFISLREEASIRDPKEILDRELSLGRPVMVTVPSTTRRFGNHYVLVYAKEDNDYLIKDPGYESRTRLSEYRRFVPRGVIVPANAGRLSQQSSNSVSITENSM